MNNTISTRLQKLNIILPDPQIATANYLQYVFTPAKDIVYILGQLPFDKGHVTYIGKVGETYSLEEWQKAARLCCLNVLAQLQAACDGNLDLVIRCLKLIGFVNTVPGYIEHSGIINGASKLVIEVFGNQGMHARAAIGVNSLPLGAAVEIEAIFALK